MTGLAFLVLKNENKNLNPAFVFIRFVLLTRPFPDVGNDFIDDGIECVFLKADDFHGLRLVTLS